MQRAYPGYGDSIARGLRADPAFRDLCEDYQRCAVALEDVRQRSDDDRRERITEYEQLLGELARDVEDWLAGTSARENTPSG